LGQLRQRVLLAVVKIGDWIKTTIRQRKGFVGEIVFGLWLAMIHGPAHIKRASGTQFMETRPVGKTTGQ
jgi:hypothetical protein